MSDQDNAAKWQKLHDEYRNDTELQEVIVEMAASEKSQDVLNQARQKWIEQGFEKAPFDFIFDELQSE